MTDKMVSVIVPVYRTLPWLARCVQSITGQTWKNLEIILVDDGSPDDCPRLCDDWAKNDSRIRVLHKKNGGLMAAWMDGVRCSTGEYLCFVDSDDWIDACMVEKLMEFTSDCGKEVICGNYVQEEKNRSIEIYQGQEPGIYTGRQLRERIFGHLLGQERRPITLSRCMKLFSRQLIEDNMKYCDPAIRMGEDVNITLPALLDAERIVVMEGAAWYHYLFLRDSMTHRYDPQLYEHIRRLYHVAGKILEEKKAPHGETQACREFLLLLFLEIKNEARAGKRGWRQRLRTISADGEVQEALRQAPLYPESAVNRLLYRALKKPDAAVLTLVRLLLRLNAKRRR
ncbi:MAG: glycosyltransferase family 2 protein [Eubacteriales bacterium]|nr:glycosyltransferase family 2 protein [Eubacteriales bacterium]